MPRRQSSSSPSRSRSPQRMSSLADIPEANPGPNAFAQQAERLDRHRAQGNAFYQQQVQSRTNLQPTAVHPALRQHTKTYEVSTGTSLIPQQRESSATIMSTFINAGKDSSPPLRLLPSDEHDARPTVRGYIEERSEQLQHVAYGTDHSRTPVYHYEPVAQARDSGTTKILPTEQSCASLLKSGSSNTEIVSSPVRSFFDRLRLPNMRVTTPSPSKTSLTNAESALLSSNVPVKAQAVLGAAKNNIHPARTPSTKRKGLFALRRSAETPVPKVAESTQIPPTTAKRTNELDRTSSTCTKTPQTAKSDPTSFPFNRSKNVFSSVSSKQDLSSTRDTSRFLIQRSQSLKYYDGLSPPTPPAKNTPPEVKAREQQRAAEACKASSGQIDDSPSKIPPGSVGADIVASSASFGSNVHKEMPTLVTQPSIYSLRASVVPGYTEPNTFKEVKSRLDSLSLEGFNLPSENFQHRTPDIVYSPSVYGQEWDGGLRPIIRTPRTPMNGNNFTTEDLPTVHEETAGALEMVQRVNGSCGTIPLYYPTLADDPSRAHLRSRSESRPSFVADTESLIGSQAPSREHSSNTTDSNLLSLGENLDHVQYESPSSYTHKSAVPSPLQYLPATTYIPPQHNTRKQIPESPSTMSASYVQEMIENGLGISSPARTAASSPSHSSPHPLDNAPILEPCSDPRARVSPRPSITSLASVPVATGESSSAGSTATAEHLQVVAMLNTILARQTALESMRDDVRANTNRLDERLAAVEEIRQQMQNLPALTASVTAQRAPHPDAPRRRRSDRPRVTTDVALDFYRSRERSASPEKDTGETNSDAAKKSPDADALAEMIKVNQTLVTMVTGFAERLEEMEKKFEEK